MDINTAFPGNYLKAADLKGRQVPVTIERVEMEDVGGDHKPVVYFQGAERGLVLNKTNASIISDMYGSETNQWGNKRIVLYPARVEFQGRLVDAIRVQHPGVAQTQQAPLPQQAPEPPPFDSNIPF